jgi:hypothetical protein
LYVSKYRDIFSYLLAKNIRIMDFAAFGKQYSARIKEKIPQVSEQIVTRSVFNAEA